MKLTESEVRDVLRVMEGFSDFRGDGIDIQGAIVDGINGLHYRVRWDDEEGSYVLEDVSW